MDKAIKIIIALFCIPLLILGIKAMFAPTGMFTKFGVTAMDANGLNTIRGHLGGTLIAGSAMMAIGLWKNNTTWFLSVALFMLLIAFGRLVGFAFDGVAMEAVPVFVGEIVISALMFVAHKRFPAAK